MKMEIYGQIDQPEEKTYLRLVYTGKGVELQAVDLEGNPVVSGLLMGILHDGSVTLRSDIDPNLGFKLDARGRLDVVREG